MKKILSPTILAGLFALMISGFTPIVFADEERTPAPAEETPAQQEPAEPILDEPSDTEPVQEEIVPLEPPAEPSDVPAPEIYDEEVTPSETPATVNETTPEVTEEQTVENVEEPTATTDPTPVAAVADPLAVAAKVIVVDRTASTMTLEVNGKLQLVKITPQVRILKKGKLVSLEEITSGQNIVLLARPLENGTFEVVSVAIGPAKGKAQPAGGSGKALGVGFGQRVKDNPPFFNFPNPANQLGPVISPNQ